VAGLVVVVVGLTVVVVGGRVVVVGAVVVVVVVVVVVTGTVVVVVTGGVATFSQPAAAAGATSTRAMRAIRRERVRKSIAESLGKIVWATRRASPSPAPRTMR